MAHLRSATRAVWLRLRPRHRDGPSHGAPRDGIEPSSLILIQSQAGPASRPTGDRRPRGHTAYPSRVVDAAGHNGTVTETANPRKARGARARMSGRERREQLIGIGRKQFANKGFEGATVEDIAAAAGVSKPVVYEHFGGKEGLYAVVVDREIQALVGAVQGALTSAGSSRELIERAAMALLDYIESSTDGFRILVRDSPTGHPTGTFASIMSDIASQVEHLLAAQFKARNLDPKTAPMYAQMLVGMVALVGQWWLDSRKFKKDEVAAHVVNLAWNGLTKLDRRPTLTQDSH